MPLLLVITDLVISNDLRRTLLELHKDSKRIVLHNVPACDLKLTL